MECLSLFATVALLLTTTKGAKTSKVQLRILPHSDVFPSTVVTLNCSTSNRTGRENFELIIGKEQKKYEWLSRVYVLGEKMYTYWNNFPPNSCRNFIDPNVTFCTAESSVSVNFTATRALSGPVFCTVDKEEVSKTLRVSDVILTVTPSNPRVGQQVEVSCSFQLAPSHVNLLKMTGLKWWSYLPDKEAKVGNYILINRTARHIVTAADNGQNVTCSIGQWKRSKTLKILYPPTITAMRPSNNSVITVGQKISCSFEANPPAEVIISYGARGGSLSEGARGWKRAELTVPMETEAGELEVECQAENSMKIVKERGLFRVKKRNIPLSLEITPQTTTPPQIVKVKCQPSPFDPDVTDMSFEVGGSFVNFSTTFTASKENWKLRTEEAATFIDAKRSAQFSFRALPKFQEITCRAKGPSKIRKGEVTHKLSVTWPPSIRTLHMQDKFGPITSVIEGRSVVLNCTFQLGNPPRVNDVTISGLPGAAKEQIDCRSCSWRDGEGYAWRTRLWTATFNRFDHARRIFRCSLAGREKSLILNVTYPPTITAMRPSNNSVIFSSSNNSVGQKIFCSSLANPPAAVIISYGARGGSLSEGARGWKRAEMTVPMETAAGKLDVTCQAANMAGIVWSQKVLRVKHYGVANAAGNVQGSSFEADTSGVSSVSNINSTETFDRN